MQIDGRDIALIIKIVADKAWGIAANGDTAERNICLRIEDLSDDPEILKKLIEEIKENVKRSWRSGR